MGRLASQGSTRALRPNWADRAARLAVILTLSLPGCFARAPRPLPALEAASVDEARVLRVRLHFGAEADLDLHVTDPLLETVYFGNNPSLGGGALERDLRCGDPAPRTEVVTFEAPRPGPYRIGVDFVTRCRRVRDPVPYEIEVVRGDWVEHLEGAVRPGRFDHKALEFVLEEVP